MGGLLKQQFELQSDKQINRRNNLNNFSKQFNSKNSDNFSRVESRQNKRMKSIKAQYATETENHLASKRTDSWAYKVNSISGCESKI